MNTLTLSSNANGWDLATTPSATVSTSSVMSQDIAMTTGPMAIAQDVASIIQTYQGEAYFDTTIGVPYFASVFGQSYVPTVIQGELAQAALTVPGVVQSKVTGIAFNETTRAFTGTVNVTDTTGAALGVTF